MSHKVGLNGVALLFRTCDLLQCNAMQCNAMQCNAMQYNLLIVLKEHNQVSQC